MGCHTWFYTKTDNIEMKEINSTFISTIRSELNLYTGLLELITLYKYRSRIPQKAIRRVLGDVYVPIYKYVMSKDDNFSKNKVIFRIKYLSKILELYMFNKLKQETIIKRVTNDFTTDDIYYHNGVFYKGLNGIHDIFRIGGYPNEIMLSLNDTLEFLNTNENKVFYENVQFSKLSNNKKNKLISELKKFWNDYPDGLIKFD